MKIVKFISLSFLFFGFLSCSKNLDQVPKTNITAPVFYKTEDQLIKAVNGIYRQLGIVYDAKGLVDIGAEERSDNVVWKQAAGTQAGVKLIYEFQAGPSNQVIRSAWEDGYKAIYICNNVIDKIKNSSANFSDPSLKKRLIAEATAVRALIFFDMVRNWGPIPLPLKPLSIEESFQISRTDVDEVYNQIINDLKEAKKYLPESYSNKKDIGRMTKYGAAAILAKVYITRGETQKAKNELKEIIDSNLYSLDTNNDGIVNKDDYLYLFQPNTKNCKGSIVEVQYMSGPNGVNSDHQNTYRPFDQRFHPRGVDQTRAGGNGGINTPSQDLIDVFEPADSIRKSISAASGFYTLNTHEFVAFPYTRKFYDIDYLNAGQNFEIIRYADILLLYAEVTKDPKYLNMVRARVGLPLYGESGYPNRKYNTFERAIEHERRVELCFEFHRFYDLARHGRAIQVMKAKGYDINKNKLLLPIPQHVIDVNPKIKQNPGY